MDQPTQELHIGIRCGSPLATVSAMREKHSPAPAWPLASAWSPKSPVSTSLARWRMASGCQALRARPLRAACWVTVAPAIRCVATRSGAEPDGAGMRTVMWRWSERCRAGS